MTMMTNEKTHNLLVIDDEREILMSLKRQFRRDYDVYIANSAEEGLEVMKEHAIQVIISDQRMPGMNGADFFDRVKHKYPDAMRLLLTGYADIEAVIGAINEGNIFRYITKPWDPQELDSIVRQAFERHDLIVNNRELMRELKEINEDLEKRVEVRTQELLALNAEKDRMLGVVAHDLRGPLGSIQMCYDVIVDESSDEETRAEFLKTINEVTEKALYLVNDLLDVSAIENGKLELSVEDVNIQGFLKKIATANRPSAERKEIQLKFESENAPEQWSFDSRRVEQVLDNLLSNAFKYSHSNTEVRLVVEAKDSQIHFRVFDQGQGIRKEDMGKLFTAFQKTSTQPTGSEDSNGLGLSICKRIVEQHNGEFDVESEFGKGSCFRFHLPKPA